MDWSPWRLYHYGYLFAISLLQHLHLFNALPLENDKGYVYMDTSVSTHPLLVWIMHETNLPKKYKKERAMHKIMHACVTRCTNT